MFGYFDGKHVYNAFSIVTVPSLGTKVTYAEITNGTNGFLDEFSDVTSSG